MPPEGKSFDGSASTRIFQLNPHDAVNNSSGFNPVVKLLQA